MILFFARILKQIWPNRDFLHRVQSCAGNLRVNSAKSSKTTLLQIGLDYAWN